VNNLCRGTTVARLPTFACASRQGPWIALKIMSSNIAPIFYNIIMGWPQSDSNHKASSFRQMGQIDGPFIRLH
jgi:hypothetical protein